ncbi:MAG TPA: PEP/pyruvate-binding domain-containing protein [Myxococcota bacterium]|nr:PEP/pyruvate-binding domain-containing protein [Myxococcota bacterium]
MKSCYNTADSQRVIQLPRTEATPPASFASTRTGGRLFAVATALPLCGLILLHPSDAVALPYIPLLFAASSIFYQILLLIALYVPFAFRIVRRRAVILGYNPVFRSVAAILPAVLLISWAVVLWMGGTAGTVVDVPAAIRTTGSLGERISRCRPISDDFAKAFGIPQGSMVVDPRPPESFNTYHLDGSCNFQALELATSLPVQDRLRSGNGNVFLVNEVMAFARDLRSALPDMLASVGRGDPVEGNDREFRYAGMTWSDLSMDLKTIYKSGLSRSGVGITGESGPGGFVVGRDGRAVGVQVGSLRFMGFVGGIPDLPESFAGLTPAMMSRAMHDGHAVAFIDTSTNAWTSRAGIIHIPAWDVSPDSLKRHVEGRAEGVLLGCRDSVSCNLASGLAAEMKGDGLRAVGLVRLPGGLSDLVENPPAVTTAATSLVLAWGLVVIAILLCASGWHLLRRRTEVFRSGDRRITGKILDLLPFTIIFAMTLSSGFVSDLLVSDIERPAWFARQVFSPGGSTVVRLAGPALLTIATISLFLLFQAARIRGIAAFLATAGLILAGLSFQHGRFFNFEALTLFQIVVLQSGIAAIMAVTLPGTQSVFARLWCRKGSFTLLPVDLAARDAACGGKVAGLALALACGIDIPRSIVIMGRAGDFLEDTHAAGLLSAMPRARTVGRGTLVVRSSAPDEDVSGAATPGKYLSLTDVTREGLVEAVSEVVRAYLANGVAEKDRVAVLVQRQVRGSLAGVALRESARKGGDILVAADAGTNFAVTGGTDSPTTRMDRIGKYSGQWLEDRFTRRELDPSMFLTLMEAVEKYCGGAREIEWTLVAGKMVLLQARGAPRADEPPLPESPASVLATVGAACRKMTRTGRMFRPVLDRRDLDEFLPRTSVCTTELLDDIYRMAGARGSTDALRILVPPVTSPHMVSIDGVCFRNVVPSHAVSNVLFVPAHILARAWYRAFPGALARRLADEYRQLVESIPVDRPADLTAVTPAAAAGQIIAARKALISGPGRLSVAIGYLTFLESTRGPRRRRKMPTEHDPFLLALSGLETTAPDGLSRLAALFPYRAMPDLAIERPRMGETADNIMIRLPDSSTLPPLPNDGMPLRDVLDYLRGAVRQVMGIHCAAIRFEYQQLGRMTPGVDVFTLSTAEIAAIANGGGLPKLRPDADSAPPAEKCPQTLTLTALEYWASTGTPIPPGPARFAGTWISSPGTIKVRIVALIDEPVEATKIREADPTADFGAIPFLVLAKCDVRTVASVPDGFGIICEGGSVLSHAGLVAAQRSMAALFGVPGASERLHSGDVVVIDASGAIRLPRVHAPGQ